MKLQVILPFQLRSGGTKARELLLKRFAVDLTSLLEVALTQWFTLTEHPPASIVDLLDLPLARLLHRRAQGMSFEDWNETRVALRDALYQVQEALEPSLTPLLNQLPRNVELQLARFLGPHPVITISSR